MNYPATWFNRLNEFDKIVVYDSQTNPKKNVISPQTGCKLIGYKKGIILKKFEDDLIVKYDCDEFMEIVKMNDINIFRIHKINDDLTIIPDIETLYKDIFMFE